MSEPTFMRDCNKCLESSCCTCIIVFTNILCCLPACIEGVCQSENRKTKLNDEFVILKPGRWSSETCTIFGGDRNWGRNVGSLCHPYRCYRLVTCETCTEKPREQEMKN